jgi:hypothetical protein
MDVYVIAGPNGAGKTTFAREFLPGYAKSTNFVNADLIAQGISPFSPETAGVRAGKLVLSEIRSFAKQRVSFAFETTLSGRNLFESNSAASAHGVQSAYFLLVGGFGRDKLSQDQRAGFEGWPRCTVVCAAATVWAIYQELPSRVSTRRRFLAFVR